jgi:DNA-binding LacI/PurR family transcriptional regulator
LCSPLIQIKPESMISTIALARLCGISQGTVDRALHGRPGVKETTRQRVLQAAARHGHRPHPATREILAGRSAVVQAAFPDVNNIFFMDLATRLAAALKDRGLRLQITPVKDRHDLLEMLGDAAARRHRLAVFIPPEEDIVVPSTLSRHLPLVAILNPCRGQNVSFLSPNEETTGRDGVDYLYHLGHRKITFLSSSRRAYPITARANGYRKRAIQLGLRPKIVFSPDPSSWTGPLPTALFCHNDWLGIQAILALRQRGISVPEQVSVLGIDGTPTLSALFPDLTTMAYPIEALISAILARLDGKTQSVRAERFQIISRQTVLPLS